MIYNLTLLKVYNEVRTELYKNIIGLAQPYPMVENIWLNLSQRLILDI